MRVISIDPYLTPTRRKQIKTDKWVEIEQLQEEADIITLHVPLTDETRHMINLEFLQKCCRDLVLINFSRGAVVNYADLFKYLEQGNNARFILDVYENEPFIPRIEAEFQGNFFLTPHIGANTTSSLQNRCFECNLQIEDYLMHKKPHGLIDPDKGY